MGKGRVFHIGAVLSLVWLIGWLVAWEAFVAPLQPGSWLLALKALPLLLPLRGVIKRDLYTLQWSSMLILIYLAEGSVRAYTDTGVSAWLAYAEIALVGIFFLCSLLYLRPYKKAAKTLAKQVIKKASESINE